eukprot:CAMPEP_0113533182 /NCGR_PEP_ID=MMETSP0015_2-20120614/4460_1 /TAXON_ID=2838 /ORGANISM="Odontella" /LENGTH=138 /DNA_ID=CAMNT_0000432201 /DNA_START=169 /DNA_END=585 /DNA_ORIENTATION=- /assembly_acc=CAM_ASM_000160
MKWNEPQSKRLSSPQEPGTCRWHPKQVSLVPEMVSRGITSSADDGARDMSMRRSSRERGSPAGNDSAGRTPTERKKSGMRPSRDRVRLRLAPMRGSTARAVMMYGTLTALPPYPLLHCFASSEPSRTSVARSVGPSLR